MRASMELGGHTVSWSQASGTVALKVTPGPRNFRGKRAEEKVLPLIVRHFQTQSALLPRFQDPVFSEGSPWLCRYPHMDPPGSNTAPSMKSHGD